MECVFCCEDGGEVFWQDDVLCVVFVIGEYEYLGFCWVIWVVYVVEFFDFGEFEWVYLMCVVYVVEWVVCCVMQLNKVNFVSFGNMVLYVYWYVILCFFNDVYFLQFVWVLCQCSVFEVLLCLCVVQVLLLYNVVCEEI